MPCYHFGPEVIGVSDLWSEFVMLGFTITTLASPAMISWPSIYLEEESLSSQKHMASSQN